MPDFQASPLKQGRVFEGRRVAPQDYVGDDQQVLYMG